MANKDHFEVQKNNGSTSVSFPLTNALCKGVFVGVWGAVVGTTLGFLTGLTDDLKRLISNCKK